MGIGPQRPSARGSPDHPYSALNLRLALAFVGAATGIVGCVLAWRLDQPVVAIVAATLAGVAIVDLVIVQLRRSARRRAEGDGDHTLFE